MGYFQANQRLLRKPPATAGKPQPSGLAVLIFGYILSSVVVAPASAASIREARRLYHAGQYSECAELAAEEMDGGVYIDQWLEWKIRAELATGDYAAALETIEEGLNAYPFSAPIRLLAADVYRMNDLPRRAVAELESLERRVVRNPRRYSTPRDKVALGRLFLAQNADARQVLELFYDPVVLRWPDLPDAFLASAELALSKNDNALAAEVLSSAPEEAHADPHYHYLLARAFMKDDPEQASSALTEALKLNPRHVDSLLLSVDNLVDAEQYDDAREVLDQVKQVNSRHPRAWAYEAVLDHLEGDEQGEQAARDAALSSWSSNPEVDHLIGRKLSEKYRFAEGAAYQRKALLLDSDYLPARIQLGQDLLRLGREEEGWQLMQDAFESDGYNVVAHNLVTLHDNIASYRVLANDDFRVRMDAREADIYGHRVLSLLSRAKQTLCKKYDVQLSEPIAVEIFAQQSDFAVRTFGMPGVAGFLGVCFGNVITANSPAALGETQANWEAVLWHEFCHVVTLKKTRNKMPRWLSEGISVYEEKQENGAWGQLMNPQYRQFILDGEMPPVSELSSSFLAPPSAMHLQFAYYQSSLVVEHIIDAHGLDAIKATLDDLGAGITINDALSRNVAPINRLDAAFEKFARERAEALAPDMTWDEVELPADADSSELADWLEDYPDSVPGLKRLAVALQREERWEASVEPARTLAEGFSNDESAASGHRLLARAYQELDDSAGERQALEDWADLDGDTTAPLERLTKLARETEDWDAVLDYTLRRLAINPLLPAPHRDLAEAAERLGSVSEAIDAQRALLHFDTSDPADAHFRLAELLRQQRDASAARREVLMALEEAPRFRAAHELLLELVDEQAETTEESGEADESESTEQDESAEASKDPATDSVEGDA